MTTSMHDRDWLLNIPPELLLAIYAYLDLPDLSDLARLSPVLAAVTTDVALHRNRLRIVAPSRVNHALFNSPRPTIADLIQLNIMRGLGIERRWRMGQYFYSAPSVRQYEISLKLQNARVRNVIAIHVAKKSAQSEKSRARGFLDAEGASPVLARALLPIIRQLKWSIRRDALARQVRAREQPAKWVTEGHGRSMLHEGERVRLALCPSIRKTIAYWSERAA